MQKSPSVQQRVLKLNEDDAEKVLRLLDALEELDDVQEVHTNAVFPQGMLESEAG
jgi:transcriptional/translational regulatory protein YebC/TACO1